MPLLPPFLRHLFDKKQRGGNLRAFAFDDQLVVTVREIANQQHRHEEDVYDAIIEAGINKVRGGNDKLAEAWDSLPFIEQEITALLGLDFNSYEVAAKLNVSYDTVRYHCKHIYKAFGSGRKELRQALKNWDWADWWEKHHS